MKKALFIAATLMVIFCAADTHAGGRYGGYRSYGFPTPKSYSYGGSSSYKSYSPVPSRNYSRGGEIYIQNGYSRSNGAYVMPHFKTMPDNYKWNNLGTWGK